MLKLRNYFCLGNLGAAITLGSLLVVSGSAAFIPTGQANISGTALVGSNFIDFFGPPLGSTPNTFSVNQPDTGGFSGLLGGTIQDITGLPVLKQITFLVPTSLANPLGKVFFDLQAFGPTTGTAAGCSSDAVGSLCTPAGSPFTLKQTAAMAVEIDLNVLGISYAGSSATGFDPTVGLLTTQNLIPGTISGVLAQVRNGGITNSYSATFSATAPNPTPEPASMFLLGTGLIGVGFSVRKKFASRS